MCRKAVILLAVSLACYGLNITTVNKAESYAATMVMNQQKNERLDVNFYFHPSVASVGQRIKFFGPPFIQAKKLLWNFGDGNISSESNPSHYYVSPNIYWVTLLIVTGRTKSISSKYVIVKETNLGEPGKPKADFYYEPAAPQAGVPVKFYDISSGNPDRRLWQFGFFEFSLLKNPVKVYYESAIYKVVLKVQNKYGSDVCVKYVEVGSVAENIKIAKSCNLKDVQAAIAQANPGDTVVVPVGSAVWGGQLVINKGIILKAASKGGVVITSNYAGYLIKYTITNPSFGEPFRISGFKFDLGNRGGGINIVNGSVVASRNNRIDNNEFRNNAGYNVLKLEGTVYGVFDSNVVYSPTSVVVGVYGNNESTWNNLTFDFGTEDNWYFEDNNFSIGDGLINAGAAGRYSFRYNTVTNIASKGIVPVLDMHGNMGTNGNLSGMGIEVYGNTFNLGNYGCNVVQVRGGKALIYDNTVSNNGSWANYQVREEHYDYLNPPARSPLSGQPQHVSETYCWGNKKNGANVVNNHSDNLYAPVTLTYTDEGVVPRENVHFWKWVSPFDGSVGVGAGLASQRPATGRQEGVAWWSTDEKKLYRWKNGRWELYYVPYTYPHPLRNILIY